MCASSNLPVPFTNGDEEDALSGKKHHRFCAGKRKKIKRGYQRRARKAFKRELAAGAE